VDVSTIDTQGNIHDGAGRFAEKGNSAPAGLTPSATGPVVSKRKVLRYRATEVAATAESEVVAAFEATHPDGSFSDIAAFLAYELEPVPDDISDRAREQYAIERGEGVAALTIRLAEGQAGTLVDVEWLRPGDRIDLSRILTEEVVGEERASRAATDFGVVADLPTVDDFTGEVMLKLEDGSYAHLPIGTVLPTVSVSFRGEQYTERQLVEHLVKIGELEPDVWYSGASAEQRRRDPRRRARVSPQAILDDYRKVLIARGAEDMPRQVM